MYKGIGTDEEYPYILRGDRESEKPTIWMLRPQKVRKGNRNLAGYMKTQGKATDDAVADSMTKADLNQFIDTVASVKNFCFKAEVSARELIESLEDLQKVFFELDFNSMTELFNASRDIFSLREGEKKESSFSSGAGSIGSTPGASASSAKPV
jgi:hypothetical protein